MGEMDWNQAAGGSREVYPTGTYKVEITNWKECTSSKGTPQIRWFSEIKEPDEYHGKTLVEHTPLTDASLWRIASLVKGCGIDLSNLPKMEIGSEAFKRVLDACVHQTTMWNVTYNEQYKNNKIEEYLLTETELKVVDMDEDEACPI